MIKLLSRKPTALRLVNPSSTKIRIFTSSPFPYTTLFRSACEPGQKFGRRAARVNENEACVGARLELSERALEDGDRKSTRLNSSHLGTSYAVFCLKKKKIKIFSAYAL